MLMKRKMLMRQNKQNKQTKNVDEKKNDMARITQNKRIALFSLWSFNQSESGKKRCRNICLMERKIFFMIAKA